MCLPFSSSLLETPAIPLILGKKQYELTNLQLKRIQTCFLPDCGITKMNVENQSMDIYCTEPRAGIHVKLRFV